MALLYLGCSGWSCRLSQVQKRLPSSSDCAPPTQVVPRPHRCRSLCAGSPTPVPWVTVLGATVSISSCVASGRAPKGTEPRCHRPHSRLGGRWLCWSVGAGRGVALAASAPGHRPSPWLQEGQGRTCTPLNVPSHVWLFVVSQNARLGDTENTDSDHDAGRPTVRGGETRAAPPPRRAGPAADARNLGDL